MTAYNQHFIHRLPIPLLDPLIFHSFQFHLLACKDFQSPVYLPNSFAFKMWPLPLFSPCWAGMNGWLRNVTFIDRLIRATVYLQSPLILNSPESMILLPPLYQWRNRIKGLGNPMVTQLLVLRQSFCPSSHLLFLFWCRPPGTSHAPAAPRARWSQGMVKSHRNFFVACVQIYWYSKAFNAIPGGRLTTLLHRQQPWQCHLILPEKREQRRCVPLSSRDFKSQLRVCHILFFFHYKQHDFQGRGCSISLRHGLKPPTVDTKHECKINHWFVGHWDGIICHCSMN